MSGKLDWYQFLTVTKNLKMTWVPLPRKNETERRPCIHHCLQSFEFLKHEFKEFRDLGLEPRLFLRKSGARGRSSCLYTAPMHISLFVLSIGYVLVSHCQQARYVHQFVHQYGWAWSTPLPHVYIHRQKHRLASDSVNHYQLSFRCNSMNH